MKPTKHRRLPVRVLAVALTVIMLMTVIPMSTVSAETTTLPKSNLWTETSWVNTFETSVARTASGKTLDLYMAKNEYESGQILWRNSKDATIQKVEFTNLKSAAGDRIPHTAIDYNFVEYMAIPFNSRYDNVTGYYDETFFPDPLSNATSCTVSANTTQAIWVTVRTEKDTPAGQYSGTVTLTTTIGTFEMPMSVKVYDVVIPDADESEYVNIGWIHPEATVSYAFKYGIGSDVWWQIMEEYAYTMNRDRITNLTIPLLDLLAAANTTVTADGKYTFDWSIADRYIEFFLKECNINMLENLSSLISGTFGGGAPAAHILEPASGETIVGTAGVFSDEAENFMSQYLPALEAHLKEKGWHDMWYQYIGDEPTSAVVPSWTHAYDNWLKKYTTLKCHCAFGWADGVVEMLTDRVDMWVPLISSYDGNLEFFADRVKNHGEKVINYTCTVPQGKYINRFIDGTFTRTRILHWYNYLTDCTGTLHWGYDYWMWGGDLPNSPGDICIVYADEDNYKLKQSIRGALLRDGIEEYEVFYMLAQRDEKKADGLVSQVVTSATSFVEDDPALMQSLRIQALEALAGKGYSVAGTVYGDGDVTADKDRVNKGDSVKFTVSGKPTKVTVTVGGKAVNPAVSGNTYTVKNVTGPVVLHAAYGNEPAPEDISKFDPKPTQGNNTTKPVIPTNPGDNDPDKATDNGLDGYLRVDAASGVIVVGSLGADNTLTVSEASVNADSEAAIKAVGEKYTLIKVELSAAATAQVQLPLPEGYSGSRCKVFLVTDSELVDCGAVAYDGKLAFTTDAYGVFAVVEKAATVGNDGKGDPSAPEESVPGVDTPADSGNLLWLWIVLGAVVAAGVAVAVVLVVKKSKKGGAA